MNWNTLYKLSKNFRSVGFGLITYLAMTSGTAMADAPLVYDIKVVELAGRPGHQGLFPIQGQPVEGAHTIVKAILINGVATQVTLLFRDAGGKLLSQIPMVALPASQVMPGTYFADVVIPNVPFSMSITGADQTGNSFESSPENATLSTPQTLDVKIIPSIFDVSPEFPIYITAHITNYGNKDTFNVKLDSDVGGTVQPVTNSISLAPNRSADVEFLYTAPKNLPVPSRITLTATATSNSSNTTTNQAILSLETPITPPEMLTAWINKGDQGILVQKRHNPLTVWLCGGVYQNQTILLANGLPPVNIKVIQPESTKLDTDEDVLNKDPSKSQCGNSPILKLQFDSKNLIASLNKFASLSDADEQIHVPIAAHSADGTYFIGYVPLKFQGHQSKDK